MNKRLRVLVTGGAGFIGSHLCEYLLKQGQEVIAVDNFYTGRKSNVDPLSKQDFELREIDINQLRSNNLFCFDQVYNLACPAAPEHYQKDPVKTIETCTLGTYNILQQAIANNARFLQASTSEIYGDPTVHPQSEDYEGNVNCIGPRSCYDEGKRVAEAMTYAFKRKYNLDIRIARIFNTYGPLMNINDGRVIPNFICQSLEDEIVTVYGNGQQTRSFCYVTDLVQGLFKLMNTEEVKSPINLGNPIEIKMIDLAKSIIQLTRSESKILNTELPEDDPMKRKPDITLANQILNWKPKIGLKEGLTETINYFKDQFKKESPNG